MVATPRARIIKRRITWRLRWLVKAVENLITGPASFDDEAGLFFC
jgi:hypothetical protein